MSIHNNPSARFQRQTLATQVYEYLKEMIMLNELPGGTRLNEAELGSKLSVSPTPIREAVNKLRGEGLVMSDSWKGSRVRELSDRDVLQILDLRRVLEIHALEKVVDGISHDDLAWLTHNQQEYEAAYTRTPPDRRKAAQINADFHLFSARKANNPWLTSLLERQTDFLHVARAPITQKSDGSISIKEHAAIVEALTNGDSRDAVLLLEDHLVRVADDLIALRRSITDAGDERNEA